MYVIHINRGLGHTKGEYCNVVIDHCVDHKTFALRGFCNILHKCVLFMDIIVHVYLLP